MSPPKRFASHLFFITAIFKASHEKQASKFVWIARPIPSMMTKSVSSLFMRSTSWQSINLKPKIFFVSFNDSWKKLWYFINELCRCYTCTGEKIHHNIWFCHYFLNSTNRKSKHGEPWPVSITINRFPE